MNARRAGFTLVELLITIMIIGLMATMLTLAVNAAMESAKIDKTKSLIAKLDTIIRAKYESYKTRRVPIVITPPFGQSDPRWASFQNTAAKIRLDALRDLMRMELPDRWNDVNDPPYSVTVDGVPYANPEPAVHAGFRRRYLAGSPSEESQGAECLYMIVMASMVENDGDSRGFFKSDDVADTDGDGFPEFVDAWGRPIMFLRWAPGFASDLQIVASGKDDGSAGSTTFSATSNSPVSTESGAYNGCAVAAFDAVHGCIDCSRVMNAITKYQYANGKGTFTFVGSSSAVGGGAAFVILAPDPFDPRHVDAQRSPPIASFALYPLIYSAGPDKKFGVVNRFNYAAPDNLHYVQTPTNMNPFYSGTLKSLADPVGVPAFIGWQHDDPDDKSGVTNAWKDNIHNHQIAIK